MDYTLFIVTNKFFQKTVDKVKKMLYNIATVLY